jgi:hypothetical protein
MNYLSASTKIVDPFRAGVEIGDKLAGLPPEVVLVFCTIHYIDAIDDLVDGIKDVLGKDVLICGGTGDGIYETGGMANHGVCALGIQTEGQSQWKAVLVRDVKSDSAKAAEKAVADILSEFDGPITLAFVLADGLKADGSWMVEGLRGIKAPCFGGLAADDRRFERSIVFNGSESAEDALILLGAAGRVPFHINAASGWKPVGDVGLVTRVEGVVVHEIDNRPAEVFLREQTGKTMGGMELAVLPLAEYTPGNDHQFVLRSCSHIEQNGPVTLFGRVSEGSRVRVCHAALEEILGGVDTTMSGVKDPGFEPGAAIIISCAGRKWLLPESGQEEIERTIKEMGAIPLVGIPSYGEISPFRSAGGLYSSAKFHNVTFVVCILGK